MGLLTKNILPKAAYLVWNNANANNGDILGVQESLGRPAKSVTIESTGGTTTVKFNVSKKVFSNYGPNNQSWVGTGAGANRPSPILVDEIEETVASGIVIASGATRTFSADEIQITDIKIEALSAGSTTITVL
jgi:hypothetical protein